MNSTDKVEQTGQGNAPVEFHVNPADHLPPFAHTVHDRHCQCNASGWKQEHPKANVPALIADHAELEDQSYRNDAMPSFAFKHVEKTPFEIVLYVDYEDKNLSDSEGDDYRRFYVTRQNWEKGSDLCLYHGDDINVALAVTLAAGKMVQTDALNTPEPDTDVENAISVLQETGNYKVERYV